MENKTGSLLNSYELGKLLGQGTFAKVYHGRSIETGQSVAIKVIDKEKVLRVGLTEQVKREISVMRRVRHPNIVHLYEVLATKTKIYFVMEYAKGGELFNKVAKGKLKEDVAHKYFKQLINAVDFCHSNGVYHRDLKPENLLLDENENLKVSDFGLSALAESRRQDGLLHTACGTPAYVAPEVISKKGYNGAKADIWSCGVILFVLLANYLPFHDSNLMELYRKIGKAEFKFPKGFPQDARKLVIKMLEPNPETRVSMEKIRESGWFRKEFSSTNAEGNPGPSGSTETEPKQESIKPTELNAFDIISFSFGFDLTGFFEESDEKKEARFTSLQPASVIISRLMEMAKSLGFKIKQIEKGLLKFETEKEGKRGAVSIDVEIFEFTPALYMVEMRKSDGGTIEYQKMMEEDIRPALQDIVWAWQGTRSYYLSFVTDGEWVDDGVCWSYKGNIITNALVVSLDVNYSTLRKKLAEKIGLNEERFQIMLKYISPVRPNLPPLEVNDDDDLEAFKFLNLQSKTAVWHIELCVSLKERGVKKSTEMDETLRRKSSEMDITRSQCPPPLTQCEEMPIQNGGKSGGFVRNFVDCDVYETKPTIMHDISSVKHDINFASCDNKVESGEKSIQLEIIDLLSDSDTERGSSKEMRSRAGRKKDHAIIDVGEDFEEDVGSDENCGSDACEDSEGDIGFEKENVEVVAPLAMTFVTALILQRPMLLLDLCSRVLRMKYFGNFLWMVKLG